LEEAVMLNAQCGVTAAFYKQPCWNVCFDIC